MSPGFGVFYIGVAFFIAARLGRRRDKPDHWGSWQNPPVWAGRLLGADNGTISPYKLSGAVLGLCWVAIAAVIVLTGDPPGPPLSVLLAGAAVAAMVACAVAWVFVAVAQWIHDHTRMRR